MSRPPVIGLIARTAATTLNVAKLLGALVTPIPPGCAICGQGFDLIILYDWKPGDVVWGDKRDEKTTQWFNDAIRTRLFPEGKFLCIADFQVFGALDEVDG